eukprot:TRINITY_DN10977_c1_g1_i1.p1 TRINITY_DN10977_c1_g1~~TRINITY_DN10977_c1_g1_i1.p1  ORF type:complete len:539 (+),score=97.66 TRINITY_DN10977_c1_g1_i1:1-1617(+)
MCTDKVCCSANVEKSGVKGGKGPTASTLEALKFEGDASWTPTPTPRPREAAKSLHETVTDPQAAKSLHETVTDTQVTSCPKTWDGGCDRYKQLRLASFDDRAYTVNECRVKCEKEAGCGGFFLKKKGTRFCHIYREGCKSNGGDIWAFYNLSTCPGMASQAETMTSVQKSSMDQADEKGLTCMSYLCPGRDMKKVGASLILCPGELCTDRICCKAPEADMTLDNGGSMVEEQMPPQNQLREPNGATSEPDRSDVPQKGLTCMNYTCAGNSTKKLGPSLILCPGEICTHDVCCQTDKVKISWRKSGYTAQAADVERNSPSTGISDEAADVERDLPSRGISDEAADIERDLPSRGISDEAANVERDVPSRGISDEAADVERDVPSRGISDEATDVERVLPRRGFSYEDNGRYQSGQDGLRERRSRRGSLLAGSVPATSGVRCAGPPRSGRSRGADAEPTEQRLRDRPATVRVARWQSSPWARRTPRATQSSPDAPSESDWTASARQQRPRRFGGQTDSYDEGRSRATADFGGNAALDKQS